MEQTVLRMASKDSVDENDYDGDDYISLQITLWKSPGDRPLKIAQSPVARARDLEITQCRSPTSMEEVSLRLCAGNHENV